MMEDPQESLNLKQFFENFVTNLDSITAMFVTNFNNIAAMFNVQNIAITSMSTTVAVLERDVKELKAYNAQLEERLAQLERTMRH